MISSSKEGFPSHVWGPGLWTFIHMIALNVRLHPTLKETRGYLQFFNSLQYVLPCGTCRTEYTNLMKTRAPTLTTFSNRAKAFAWTVRLHCTVSSRLKKNVSEAIDWAAWYESLRYHPDPPAALVVPRNKVVVVEYHAVNKEDAVRIKATLRHLHFRVVVTRPTPRSLPPGYFCINTRVFSSLADVLRVLRS